MNAPFSGGAEFQPMLDIWISSAQPWVCLGHE